MSDISEVVSEAARENPESGLLSFIALLVALIATFMALCGVKAGNIGQAMAQAQSHEVDSWTYFQAKSMKQNLAESTLVQLRVQRAVGAATMMPDALANLDKQIGKYEVNVKRYEKEKNEIKALAEGYQVEYKNLNVHDDQFDLSDAALSVSIALLGITALTKKKWLLLFAIAFTLFGIFFGLAGFFEWNVGVARLSEMLG